MVRSVFKPPKSDFVIGIFLSSLVLLFKLPILNTPLYLDEISFYDGVSMILENRFNPFVEWWGYHPPLVYELAALVEHFFGFSRISLRLLILVFSFLSLWFTFLLGKALFDEEIGLWSAILLFACPLFFAQSGMFHLAIPLTALSVMSLYFYFKNKRINYLIAGSLLVLTKETGIFIIAGIAIYELFKRVRKDRSFLAIKRLAFLFFPFIPFMVWLGLNRYYLGWFFWPVYKEFFFFSGTPPWPTGSVWDKANTIFFYHWRWLITFTLLIGIFSAFFNLRLRKKFFNQQFLFLSLLPLVVFLFFSLGLFLPRYMLFVYPLLLIAFVFSIKQMVRKKVIYLFVLSLIAVLFTSCWFNYPGKEIVWGGEMNLAYLDVIRTHQKVANFLQEEYPDSRILTTGLMATEFTKPIYGYVSGGLDIYCTENIIDEPELLVIPGYLKVLPSTQELFRLRSELKLPLLKVISSGGEEVLIYKLR